MQEHIFLSYCREDQEKVRALHKLLMEAGHKVWWDQNILPGQDWKLEIKRALKKAYAVVICFSDNTQQRYQSGIFPELRDAIDIYRNHAPGKIFLIPVRFSNCVIPDMTIDATLDLTHLQSVDLFPTSQIKERTEKLLAALARASAKPSYERRNLDEKDSLAENSQSELSHQINPSTNRLPSGNRAQDVTRVHPTSRVAPRTISLETLQRNGVFLAKFSAVVLGITISLIAAPPSVSMGSFWHYVRVFLWVLFASFFVFSHRERYVSGKIRWLSIGLVTLLISIALFFHYQNKFEKWTFYYFDSYYVVVGTTLTEFAEEQLQKRNWDASRVNEMLQDFGGKTERFYLEEEIRFRSNYLGFLFFLTLSVAMVAVISLLQLLRMEKEQPRISEPGVSNSKKPS